MRFWVQRVQLLKKMFALPRMVGTQQIESSFFNHARDRRKRWRRIDVLHFCDTELSAATTNRTGIVRRVLA